MPYKPSISINWDLPLVTAYPRIIEVIDNNGSTMPFFQMSSRLHGVSGLSKAAKPVL